MHIVQNHDEDRYLDDGRGPEDVVDAIREMAGRGMSTRIISNTLGVPMHKVRSIRREHDIPPGVAAGPLTELNEARFAVDIRMLAATGVNDLTIGLRLGITSHQVSRIRARRNIAPGSAAGPGAIQVHRQRAWQLLSDGMAPIDIAAELGLTVRQLSQLGLVVTTPTTVIGARAQARHLPSRQSDDVIASRIGALARLGCTAVRVAHQLDLDVATVQRLWPTSNAAEVSEQVAS